MASQEPAFSVSGAVDQPNGPEQPSEPAALQHRLDEHALGLSLEHIHPPGMVADHDHDDLGDPGPLEENPLWLADHLTLITVGIDIGSSGTQVIFSRVAMRRLGESLSSRYVVTSREQTYQSPVALTPYADGGLIDVLALGQIIDEAYADAGQTPASIDTGAVILTGEALRRENARGVAEIVARHGGDFVCAAAGHHMEAMLAACGSGAARMSREAQNRILNVDVGGGTTKLALLDCGRVVATAAFHVGGRLCVVDDKRRIVRIEPGGQRLAERAGRRWSLDTVVDDEALDAVASVMADAVMSALRRETLPNVSTLFLTEPLEHDDRIDGVLFSGGVAEYVYGREDRDFGDLGRALGGKLRERVLSGRFPWPVLPAGACIRATALGASEYTVQISGNTIFVSDPSALLPRRNLQVVHSELPLGPEIDPQEVARTLRSHLARFDVGPTSGVFAIAIAWSGPPSYRRMGALAKGLLQVLADVTASDQPIYLIVDGDIGHTLGVILKNDFKAAAEIAVIDGVVLRNFDYIDLGRVRLPSGVVPVTVKSLLFAMEESGSLFDHHHHHAHDHAHNHDHDDHHHQHAPHHHHDDSV